VGGLRDEDYTKWYRRAGVPELTQILYWCWDPIGVNDGFPFNADEYEEYVPELLGKLRKGADAAEVSGYLRRVEREAHDPTDVGDRIVKWYGQSQQNWTNFTARAAARGRARS